MLLPVSNSLVKVSVARFFYAAGVLTLCTTLLFSHPGNGGVHTAVKLAVICWLDVETYTIVLSGKYPFTNLNGADSF